MLRELNEHQSQAQDMYQNYDYKFEQFYLNEIVRQKNNYIKVELI